MKKYSNDKEINKEVKMLISQGWTPHRGGKHGAIVAPSGMKITIPGTPSDRRAYRNFRRDVRHLMPEVENDGR